MLSSLKINIFFVALMVVLPAMVSAATPNAGQLFNEQQQMQRKRLDRFPQDEVKTPPRPVPEEVQGLRIRVEAVRFSGDVDVVGESALQNLVHDAIGKEMDFTGLQSLADRVSAYFRQQGYFLAHAYLPKQVLTGGVVEIAILAGRLQGNNDAVSIQGKLRIDPRRLQWIAEASAKPGEVVRQRDLERSVLLINDLPGISASANVERGSEPGSVRLVVGTDEAPLLGGEISVDDFGNRYTGTWRANERLNINDPLRIGDQLSISLLESTGVNLGQLNYGWPVNYRGLRASTSYSVMHYKLGQDLTPLNSDGYSRIVSAGLSYPILRSRAFNLWARVDYSGKEFLDNAFGEVVRYRRVHEWETVLSGDSFDHLGGGGLNSFSVTATTGTLDLSKNPTDLALDISNGAKTNGAFLKANYSLARLQRLGMRLSFYGAINGQYANKNLDTSEKFFLGGPLGVRAYPTGEGSGDGGWVSNWELRYDLPILVNAWTWQWVGFYDLGRISLHKSPWPDSLKTITGKNSYRLSGLGMGLNVSNGHKFALRLAWSKALGSNPGQTADGLNNDGRSDTSHLWFYGVVWL